MKKNLQSLVHKWENAYFNKNDRNAQNANAQYADVLIT